MERLRFAFGGRAAGGGRRCFAVQSKLGKTFTEGDEREYGRLRSEEVKQDALRTRLGARRTLNAERQTLNVLPSAGFGGAKKGGQDLDVADRVFQRDRLFGSFADAPGE